MVSHFSFFLTVLIAILMIAPEKDVLLSGEAAVEDDTIIVTGERTVQEIAGGFVDGTIAAPKGGRFEGQYARFNSPVCPAFYGLSEKTDRAMERRIAGVAKAAGIATGRANCKPNLFVVVIDDGPGAIDILRKRHHRIFGSLPIYQRDRLVKSNGPVYGWKAVSASEASGGSPIIDDKGAASPAVVDAIDQQGQLPSAVRGRQSLIKKAVQQSMNAAYLLIERKALADLTLVQIADFAAVYSLIEVDIKSGASEAGAETVLTLFEDRKAGRQPEDSVTEWDLMLLHALYSTPADISAQAQRSAMITTIVNEIQKAP